MSYTIRQFDAEWPWLDARFDYITGTDTPVLFSLSNYNSPRSLWLEKRNRKSAPRGPESDEQRFGKRFEPLIAEDFERATGLIVQRPGGPYTLYVAEDGYRACSIDGIAVYLNDAGDSVWRPCEWKNAWRNQAYVWDTAVPPVYQMQVMKQIDILDADMGYFGVWLHRGGPPVFRLHTIQRDDAVIAEIRKRDAAFYEMVQTGKPPAVDGSKYTSRALSEEYREPLDEAVELGDVFVDYRDEIDRIQEEADAKQAEVDKLKNRFREALGNAQWGKLPDGRAVSWKADKNGKRTLRL